MNAVPARTEDQQDLRKAINLSLGIGFLMLVIKFGAYLLTGSAAIFADAVETIVHIVAVGFAAYSLRLSQKPADENHPYGHAKISFFSAGAEGMLIVVVAIFIIQDAIRQWISGVELHNLGFGTALIALTVLLNGTLGIHLISVGRKKGSLILKANGKHILTDAWTSIGVIAGLVLASTTGWLPWDPILAIAVAINILVTGFSLMRQSISGLMDEADPDVRNRLIEVLDQETKRHGITYHELRNRHMGDGHWVDFHLLFKDETPVKTAHAIATEIERKVKASLEEHSIVTTHLEPLKDHQRIHTHSTSGPDA